MNDTLQLVLEPKSPHEGVPFHAVATVVERLDDVVAEVWSRLSTQPAPKLCIITSPRRGSIVIEFTINANSVIPLARESTQHLDIVDLMGVLGSAASVAALVLQAAFSPWGSLARRLGRSTPPPEDETMSGVLAKDAVRCTNGDYLEPLLSAAQASGCRSIRINYRGIGDVELILEKTSVELSIHLANAYIREVGLPLEIVWNPEDVSVEWSEGSGGRYHPFPLPELTAHPAAMVEWIRTKWPPADHHGDLE